MSHKPISSLSDDSFEGQPCSICGYPSVQVIHISTFPDYIECPQCGSAFILAEDCEHVLFGKINSAYPGTRAAALKQWTVMDDVLKTAVPERPVQESAFPDTETADTDEPRLYASDTSSLASLWKAEPLPDPRELIQEDEIPEEINSQPVLDQPQLPSTRSTATGLERAPVFLPQLNESQPVPDDTPDSSPIEETSARGNEQDPAYRAREPEPGKRHRVVLSGSQIRFPYKVCSHCMASPASSSLTMTAFLPDSQEPSERVPTQIRIPLCSTCRKRASAQSEQEKKARSKAFLYSASSGLLLILLLLVTGLLRASGVNVLLGIFLVIITATVGFSVPLLILLERTNRIPPPEDAFFVLSTLYLPPSPPQDMTVFDWRSPGYAELFHLANRSVTVKTVHEVEDQGPRLPNKEPQETGYDVSPDRSPMTEAPEPVPTTSDDAREDE